MPAGLKEHEDQIISLESKKNISLYALLSIKDAKEGAQGNLHSVYMLLKSVHASGPRSIHSVNTLVLFSFASPSSGSVYTRC